MGVYTSFTDSLPSRSCESYDQDGTWRPVGDLNEARSYHTATLLPGGRVLVAGGLRIVDSLPGTYPDKTLKSASCTTRLPQHELPSSLNVARMSHTATLLDDGSVLVVAGVGGDSSSGHSVLSSAELYLPAGAFAVNGAWPILPRRLPTPWGKRR